MERMFGEGIRLRKVAECAHCVRVIVMDYEPEEIEIWKHPSGGARGSLANSISTKRSDG